MASFGERMLGAARLNVNIYEEVEADTTATGQAMGVVVLHAVAAAIGGLGRNGAPALIGSLIGALLGWFVWAFVIFFIGTKLLPEPQTKSDVGELLRTTGFASAPGLLLVLGLVPLLGGVITFGVSIWMLVAMVIAVRQALDYQSTGRAVGVCVLGWITYLIVFGAIYVLVSRAL